MTDLVKNIKMPDGTILQIDSSTPDNKSITKNANEQLQTIGIINNADNSTALKTWTGTKAEYDKITEKDNTTIYNITDDDSITALIDLSDYVTKEDIKENWIIGVKYLIQNTSLPITGDDNTPGITFDLSTIIPKDGKNYEIIISGLVYTTNVSHCAINIDTGNMWCSLLTAQTTGVGNGTCTAILNNDRKIKIYNYGDKTVTLQQLTLCAYKPIK